MCQTTFATKRPIESRFRALSHQGDLAQHEAHTAKNTSTMRVTERTPLAVRRLFRLRGRQCALRDLATGYFVWQVQFPFLGL